MTERHIRRALHLESDVTAGNNAGDRREDKLTMYSTYLWTCMLLLEYCLYKIAWSLTGYPGCKYERVSRSPGLDLGERRTHS